MKIKLAVPGKLTILLAPSVHRLVALDCDPIPSNDSRDCDRNELPGDCDLKPLTPAFRVLKEPSLDAVTPLSLDSAVAADLDGHCVNVFLSLGGALPASPGPFACGADLAEDALTCAEDGCGEGCVLEVKAGRPAGVIKNPVGRSDIHSVVSEIQENGSTL